MCNRVHVCLHTPHTCTHACLTASNVTPFSTRPILFIGSSTCGCDVCVTNTPGNEHMHIYINSCVQWGHALTLLCVLAYRLRMWVGPVQHLQVVAVRAHWLRRHCSGTDGADAITVQLPEAVDTACPSCSGIQQGLESQTCTAQWFLQGLKQRHTLLLGDLKAVVHK